jgi:hypothetical protein
MICCYTDPMSPQQIAARHGVHSPDRWRMRRVFLSVLMLPAVPLAAWVIYVDTVPAYSASFHIDEIDATVRLSFYWLWDEAGSYSGRHVTVTSPKGTVTYKMCGFDWSHWARTGIYLTEDRNIAVVGTDTCDDLVSPADRTVTPARNMPSDNWTYLGAFDLKGGYGRALRFVPAANQGECIEMRGEESRYDWMVRKHARKARCA